MHAQSQSRFRTGICLTVISSTLLFLVACQQSRAPGTPQGISEIAWARMALERNPQLEVVATDTQAGVFTVRDKRTGKVQTVKVGDLAAAPVSQLSAEISRPTAAAEPMAPAAHETAPDESARYDTRSAPPAPATTSETRSATAAPTEDRKDYTIERAEGRVKVSGPGISIVSSNPATPAEPTAQSGMRKSDPIICEGPRMIHLDNRTIYVDGDGVTARAGCELYLTNSRIVASGPAWLCRMQSCTSPTATSKAHRARSKPPSARSSTCAIRFSTGYRGAIRSPRSRTRVATSGSDGLAQAGR